MISDRLEQWRKNFLDYFLVFFFSFLICMYTVIISKQSFEANGRVLVPENIFGWLFRSPNYLIAITLLFAILCKFGKEFINSNDKNLAFLYKHKAVITVFTVIVWVCLGLNNTSLYQWTYFFSDENNHVPIWGVSRPIRSDEWAVWSTFAFAQDYDSYPSISPSISGGGIETSWISVGGIPAWNIVSVFKPLYFGFLLFGLETGFSFLSISRLVLLFWSSFKFAMIYTKKNRTLSFTAAVSVTLAPYIQWWFSQSIAEVFIYAQGILISGYYYLHAKKAKEKILLSTMLAYLVGCYIMIAYPSWLISIFYLVIVLGILGAWRYREQLHWKDIMLVGIPVLIVLIILGINVGFSYETLLAVANSIYPGERLHTGKFIHPSFYSGLFSLIFPLNSEVPYYNVCELSNFISFYPAGLLLGMCSLGEKKGKDGLSLSLIILEAGLAVFMLVGVTPTIAKLTLLSQCTRLLPVFALCDTILLFHNLAGKKTQCKPTTILWFTAFSAMYVWFPGARRLGYSTWLTLGICGLGFLLYYLIYSYDPQDSKSVRRMCFSIISCAVLAGCFVNPIQKGVACVEELDLVQELRSIEDGDALYLMETDFPRSNAPLLAGKRCYNSTTVYPNPLKWEILDPDKKYEDIYNRFCHVSIELCDEDTSFELIAGDQIKVRMSFGSLRKLGIEYVVSVRDYSQLQIEGIYFVPVGDAGQFNIYHLVYDE